MNRLLLLLLVLVVACPASAATVTLDELSLEIGVPVEELHQPANFLIQKRFRTEGLYLSLGKFALPELTLRELLAGVLLGMSSEKRDAALDRLAAAAKMDRPTLLARVETKLGVQLASQLKAASTGQAFVAHELTRLKGLEVASVLTSIRQPGLADPIYLRTLFVPANEPGHFFQITFAAHDAHELTVAEYRDLITVKKPADAKPR